MSEAIASHDFSRGSLEDALSFLKRIRSELSIPRKVHVWPDKFAVFDVNGDSFEIRGAGYESAEITELLDAVNAVYRKDSIHKPFGREFKEFPTGKRYAWGVDRVM
ncbi:MAG TPA: hypothetical protein DCE43_24395 [Planctomycetaceae bacterium]|nr:hypothetical protein [Planctomycetaceae bacterium]|tara:strand:- start:13 stop:330 length:318 start_codon:yes stop_codon:yes gene_type:complete